MIKNKKWLLISLASIVLTGIVIVVVILFLRNSPAPQKEVLGSWYAWNLTLMNDEVLTFYEDGTYDDSLIVTEGEKGTYSVDGKEVHLEGYAFYNELVLVQQDDQVVLKAEDGFIYYRNKDSVPADLSGETQEEIEIGTEIEKGNQGEDRIQETKKGEGPVTVDSPEQVSEDIVRRWLTATGVNLIFERDNTYMLIYTDHTVKFGTYKIMGANSMIISDPETQAEKTIEFTLTREFYIKDADRLIFTSKYFEWAGDYFFRYEYFNIEV
jgi:hypothetical protein